MSYSLVVTCCERADFLALLYVMVSSVFVTSQYGVLGQVWYMIVLITDLSLLPDFKYFINKHEKDAQNKLRKLKSKSSKHCEKYQISFKAKGK